MTLIGLHSLQSIWDENTFFLAQTTYHEKPSLMSYVKRMFSDKSVNMHYQNCTDCIDQSWYHLDAYIYLNILLQTIWAKTHLSLLRPF